MFQFTIWEGVVSQLQLGCKIHLRGIVEKIGDLSAGLDIVLINWQCQMNSLAASVKLTYSASMVDRLTDFCLKVRDEIGVSSIKVMNPPIDTRSSLFVAKSESE
ncbi:hypothetical protein TNCV_4246611 [Trichonephila clavipes]|nr:hypothetical protein TNCV_4246611 [Trichonephila clavipes]